MESPNLGKIIDCPEAMIDVIRRMGIVPFFKNPIVGWSIEEMTVPGFWWDTEGVLGPWDWKIDAVRDGIAYGKFIGDRAAFITEEWFRELMNYRRSLPKYRVAVGYRPHTKANSKYEKLMRILSKPALDAIKEAGALESRQLRSVLAQSITPSQIRSLGASYKTQLVPTVKKSISDYVVTFLQMGTWCLVGDFEKVYRGPNLVYSGWQLSSITTPELFWGDYTPDSESPTQDSCMPSWARRFEEVNEEVEVMNLGTPEESRQRIIDHIMGMYPDADPKALEKLI